MTLYDLLSNQISVEAKVANDNFFNNDEFYKALGGVKMCSKLITMLSDDTLKMEVMSRHDALKKGE